MGDPNPTTRTPPPGFATPAPAWSVSILSFNERETLEEAVLRTLAVMRKHGEPFEVLVVDDGSTDGSDLLAERLADEHAEVRVHRHARNLGIGEALLSGYRRSRGRIVVILPADLQFAPEDLPPAMAALDGADVVNISRSDRQDHFGRKIISFVDKALMRLLFGVKTGDLHWIKIYRRHVLDGIDIQSRTPLVDTELLVKACRMGARIVEISLPHYPRTKGESKGATPMRLIKTFVDLLKLRWRM